jgi:Flp pilus assembly pilin Flp
MNWSQLSRLIRDDEAATAAEYAIMLALIVGGAISAISAVGGSTSTGWSKNVNIITSAVNAAGS